MELRSAGIRRLLVVFVCAVCGYVLFYNSLLLDRRGAPLYGECVPVPDPTSPLSPARHHQIAAAPNYR